MNAKEHVYHVTAANYEEVVEKSPLPVLLDIGASWCPDCIRIEPAFLAYAEKHHNEIRFAQCNFDKEEALNEKFQVRHIPTILYIVRGEVRDVLVEPKNKALFDTFVEKALKSNA